MPAKKIEEPKCIEVSVQHSGGGKVQLYDYGKVTSQWGCSFTRRYTIPEGWTEDQVAEFKVQKHAEIREQIDAIDQKELDERMDQTQWGQG